MNRNLYIVESPLQLLSALEAREYFKEDYSILILKYSGDLKNDAQILRVLKKLNNFDEVIEVRPFFGVREANFRLLIILKIFQVKKTPFLKIFIGEYRSRYHRLFFDILVSEENYLLDDGAITIELQNKFIPTGKYYTSIKFSNAEKKFTKWAEGFLKQNYFRLISHLFYIPKNVSHQDIHIFTCFDLKPYNQNQKVIKNTFAYSNKFNKRKYVDEAKVYFFGSYLSELNILRRDLEFSLLEKIIRYYRSKNKELVYIPHRREKIEKLELIQDKFNINLFAFSYPAEIQFLLMDVHPYGISSFISTALFTVSKIFDFSIVDAFCLPMEQIPEGVRQAYISVYNEYKKTMNIIDLNELS